MKRAKNEPKITWQVVDGNVHEIPEGAEVCLSCGTQCVRVCFVPDPINTDEKVIRVIRTPK